MTRRPRHALLVLLAAAVAAGGCGEDSPEPPSFAEVDAKLARAIDESAQRGAAAFRSVGTEAEIADINAENDPPAQTATTTTSPATSTAKPAKPKSVATTPRAPARPARRSPARRAPARPSALLSAADRAAFSRLAAQLGGSSGIAVMPAGRSGTPQSAGGLTSGVAWSTMKAGVAAATFARGTPGSSTQNLLRRAITASDNAAAEQLWSALGSPDQAGALVRAQLQAAGDTATSVQTQRVRSGFTAFGQTQWALADQVRFAAGMTCTAAGRSVLQLMGQVIPGQRWGLGSAGVPARFKGGWGPGTGGGYLVRQMGTLTLKGHPVAVAIATLPANGSFDTGTANLTRIATWLVEHLDRRAAPIRPVC